MTHVLGQMRNLEVLDLSECFTDPRHKEIQSLIDSVLVGCQQLRQLDLSKNQFSRDNQNHIFKSIATKGKNLDALALSQIGLNHNRDTLGFFVQMINNLGSIRKLNISGNERLTHITMQQVFDALLKNHTIEDLDFSKTGVDNDARCMVLLAEMISNNQNLRAVSMQRINLNESSAFPLIHALSNTLSLETLNFDFNNLGSSFVKQFVEKVLANKRIN